jgi:hypothetical protein
MPRFFAKLAGAGLLALLLASLQPQSLGVSADNAPAADTGENAAIPASQEAPSPIPAAEGAGNDEDFLEGDVYITNVPVTITATVGGTSYRIDVDEGGNLREAALQFCRRLQLPLSNVRMIEDALRKEADNVYAARVAAAEAAEAAAQSQSQYQGEGEGEGEVAYKIDVNVDGVDYPCTLRAGESQAAAARRFASQHRLSDNAEYDSVLRILVNRLRREQGHTDGLPRSTDTSKTVATVNVVVNDKPGLDLTLRILEGETPSEAALGFLERTGFDMAYAVPLTREAEAQVERARAEAQQQQQQQQMQQQQQQQQQQRDEMDGESISIDVSFADGTPSRPLRYVIGQNALGTAGAFLTSIGRANHPDFTNNANQIAAAIEANVRNLLDARARAKEAQAAAALAASEPIAVGVGGGAEAPVPSPLSASVPLFIGNLRYDIIVTAGNDLRDIARGFCAQEWTAIAPYLDAALEDSNGASPGQGQGQEAKATPAMCAGVTFDVLAQYFTTLAKERAEAAAEGRPLPDRPSYVPAPPAAVAAEEAMGRSSRAEGQARMAQAEAKAITAEPVTAGTGAAALGGAAALAAVAAVAAVVSSGDSSSDDRLP